MRRSAVDDLDYVGGHALFVVLDTTALGCGYTLLRIAFNALLPMERAHSCMWLSETMLNFWYQYNVHATSE